MPRGSRTRCRQARAAACSLLAAIVLTVHAFQAHGEHPSPASGDQPTTQQSPDAVTEEAAQASQPAPPPPPPYLNLRYDENYSYLDGPPGSFAPDLFDPIKWIHLTDDLTLSIGGEMRARMEAETNTTFGSREPAQDTFVVHRYLLHTDLRYRKLARVFFQGISAFVEDRDLPLLPIMENRWDFQQLFFDLRFLGEDVPLAVRFGRQDLQYGNQRLISPLDWGNTRRRFDGVKLFYESDPFDIDFFYVRPVPIDLSEGLNRKPDEYREEAHFYGIYSKYKGIKDHYIENYFLALRDTGNLTNANGRVGDQSLYTIGSRAGGKRNQFDYDAEFAHQFGTIAGDRIQAWMSALDGGWTAKLPMSPRIGGGFDFGSGDRDPNDRKHQTFNQLFPLGHAHWGYLDLFGLQNLLATNINFSFKPIDTVTTRLAWYTFWNHRTRDALYNAGGVPVRRDRTGGAGHDIGNELDLTIQWAIDRHSSLLLGYSHFWSNNFIRATGPDRDADLFYVQYAFKF